MNAAAELIKLNGKEVSLAKFRELAKKLEGSTADYFAGIIGGIPTDIKTVDLKFSRRTIAALKMASLPDKVGKMKLGDLEGLYGIEIKPAALGELGKSKNTFFAEVTRKILELVKKGELPWRKPWGQVAEVSEHITFANYISNKNYRGVNFNMCALFGGGDRYFITEKQAHERGGRIVNRNAGVPICYFVRTKKTTLIEVEKEDGKTETVTMEQVLAGLRWYAVYPLSATEGVKPIKRPDRPAQPKIWEPLEIAERIVESYPPKKPAIRHQGNEAYYAPGSDQVTMPPKSAFKAAPQYYSVLFHELLHSTGAEHRLNRAFGGKFGDKKYAAEELVAELGSSFLCAVCQIDYFTLNNSAAYLKNWSGRLIEELSKDKQLFIKTQFAALKAAKYTMGSFYKEWEKTQKPAKVAAAEKPAKAEKKSGSNPITIDDLKSDIGLKTAVNAYRHVSFDPDKRGVQMVAEYAGLLFEDWKLLSKAQDQQKAKDQFETYRAKAKRLYTDWLHAMSRVASPMIVGPARFPVERNNKAIKAEQKRYEVFSTFRKRAINAIMIELGLKDKPKSSIRKIDGDNKTVKFDGGKVVLNFEINRIQIQHDEKPDAVVISLLKKNAFKWSPTSKSWQRQLTRDAIQATSRVIGSSYFDELFAAFKGQPSSSNKPVSDLKPTIKAERPAWPFDEDDKAPAATKKAGRSKFEPVTPMDFLAEYMIGKRIQTKSWDKWADKNLRSKAIQLNWLSANGMPLDKIAYWFISEQGHFGLDEQQVIQLIIDLVKLSPGGPRAYIKSAPEWSERASTMFGAAGTKKQSKVSGLGEIVSAGDLKEIQYETLQLGDPWKDWLGNIPTNFDMTVDGAPGSGKSTLLLQFAEHLAKDLGKKVLFVSKEEFGAASLVEKVKRLNIRNVAFTNTITPDANLGDDYDVVFIDSITDLGFNVEDYKKLRSKNPDVAFVLVLQRTKSGQFRGSNEWPHEVEITTKVEQGRTWAEKNRYAEDPKTIFIPGIKCVEQTL